MSLKAVATGQFNLVNEATGQNFLSFDLSAIFGVLTGVQEQVYQERNIIVGDGVVSLNAGGVANVKGLLLIVEGAGTVTVKHDSNTNGIEVSSCLLVFGKLSSITVETSATQQIKVKYLLFE